MSTPGERPGQQLLIGPNQHENQILVRTKSIYLSPVYGRVSRQWQQCYFGQHFPPLCRVVDIVLQRIDPAYRALYVFVQSCDDDGMRSNKLLAIPGSQESLVGTKDVSAFEAGQGLGNFRERAQENVVVKYR